MNTLVDMPNIGPKLAKQLIKAQINSPYNLYMVGSRQAWLQIQQFDSSACYNRLLALE